MPPSPVKKTRKPRTKKDPNAPKRAMSAFMFFSNDIRPTVKIEQPELTFLEIASEIGRRWQALPESKRGKFQVMADKDKARYEGEKEHYTPDPSFEIMGKKKKKDPNAPKRGLSAYLFFCSAFREDVKAKNPGSKITEVASLLAGRWRELSEEDRVPYQQQADEDKVRYVNEMQIYNASK